MLFDPWIWAERHPVAALAVGAFCLWVSLSLIVRMWVLHRRVSFHKKLLWSVVLLVPLFGWLAYGGCFFPLGTINTQYPSENDWGSGSGAGSDGGGHD